MHDTLELLELELTSVVRGLDQRQAQLTPMDHPEKWTIQQIVEHLLLSYRSSAEVLETRIKKASPTKAKPMLQQRVGQFFLISLGRFPSGRHAPAAVSPTTGAPALSGEDLTQRIHDELLRVDQAAQTAEQLFGTCRCASHMVLGPLSIPQWRRFHMVHGEHHIRQITNILRDREF